MNSLVNMGDIVEDAVLFNCTGMLVLQLDPNRDVSPLWGMNRSQVLEVLDYALDEVDGLKNGGRRTEIRDFISDCLFPAPRPYDLVWWQKLVWTIIFAAMLVVSTGGNLIVMWIVLAHRRMRTVTNYFLVNLSVSDLLMSLLNCIFNFIFMINSDWPFGALYCTVNNFVANVTVAASVFTLVAISLDRYMAIVHPLRHRMSRRRARVALLVIWLASGLLALPCILYSTIMTRRYANDQIRIVCYMQWPDGRYPTSMTDYLYNLVFLGLTYLVPVTAMAVCYSLMGRELWGSRSIGELTQRQAESIKSKRKVVRMFIIVVSIFAFCWLPYHGYFIYAYHNNSITASTYVQHMYLAFYWLAMSNAMVNPLIYYWMNNRFRGYFQRIICQCCCFRKRGKDSLELRPTKHDNSHSELGRSRSEKHRGTRQGSSMQWRRRTEETQVQHVTAPTPCSNGVISEMKTS